MSTATQPFCIIHGNTSYLPSFDKHSLVLSGQIGVDFYLSLPSGTDTTGSYLTFTVSGDKHNPVPFSDGVSVGNGTYRFTCYITSVQMADEIEAFYVYSQDNYSLATANTYTAKNYLDTVISKAPETSADLIALAKAIKDYGHYVQQPLADYNGWKIGEKHAAMDCANENIDSDSENVTAKLAPYALSRDKAAGLSAGITGLQYNLELDSETTLNIYLTPDSEAGNVQAFITDTEDGLDGKNDLVVKESDGTYRVTISGISAHKLGKFYTVNVKTEKGSFDVKLCALSYADAVMNSDTTSNDLKKAVIALYKYYAATMQYRESAGYTD